MSNPKACRYAIAALLLALTVGIGWMRRTPEAVSRPSPHKMPTTRLPSGTSGRVRIPAFPGNKAKAEPHPPNPRNLTKVAGCFGSRPGATALALYWLDGNQAPDGHWEAGVPAWNLRTTALALLAYLGHGETSTAGSHQKAMGAALAWLRAQQTPDGHIQPLCDSETETLDHAIATLVLCEVVSMGEKDPDGSARRAVENLLRAQQEGNGWRDLETTAWAVMALKSAKVAEIDGLGIPDSTFEGALAFLDTQSPAGAPEKAMAACARMLLGKNPDIRNDLPLFLERLQDSRGHDVQATYFGNMACFQTGGETWDGWIGPLKKTLLDAQSPDGSFDTPGDPGTLCGGKAYTTALSSLCLEIYYRYRKAFPEPMSP